MIREGPPVAGVNCARHIRINQDYKPTKRFNAVGGGRDGQEVVVDGCCIYVQKS